MTGHPRHAFAHAVLLAALFPAAALSQDARVAGAARDARSGAVVEGVRVELRREQTTVAVGFTNAAGQFTLAAPASGRYSLLLRRLDYRALRLDNVELVSGETVVIARITLEPHAFAINPVVVSASRRAEKALDAPASVTVLSRPEVEARTALAPADHVVGVTGVDVVTTGITQHEVVARGFNNVSSGALLVLTDSRYASVPSLRINVDNFIPLVSDDVERIEVVRGPGAALYGPNSANGVMHLISRSPLDDPGTSASLVAGERGLLQAAVRHAGTIGRRLGVKLSAQYLRATDWPYEDPAETEAREQALALGADPGTLLIGLREERVERVATEGAVEWRPGPQTRVHANVGVNAALSSIELTPLGAAQVSDWRYLYVQSRVTHGRLFGQVFVNASDAGDTYLLRTGEGITDRSRMVVAQVQHGATVAGRVSLTYGADLQRTVPRTEGTITGRNESDDAIDEAGAYVHAEAPLAAALDVVAALRADYHNRLPDPIASPRAALVFRPGGNHALRLSYNRAFSTPNTNNLFLDVLGGRLPPPVQMFAARLVGVPETGFHFRRDCDDKLCMRSPFTPVPAGGPAAFVPTDATLIWEAAVFALASMGADLSGIPAPSAADVGTRLATLDIATRAFTPVSDVADVPALSPSITNTVELGYRVTAGDRASLAVDVYRAWKTDFVGSERVETPNVFFDQTTLAAYLSRYLPADSAQALATLMASMPVGTVTPVEARDPWDILVTYRNFGSLSYWGADVEASAFLSPSLAVRASYSWTNREEFPIEAVAGVTDSIPLNAPGNRGAVTLLYRNTDRGLGGELRARAAEAFTMQSGVYRGEVEAYVVVDASVDVRLSRARGVTLTLSALNLLDNRHREFVGAPALGRLVTVRVRAEW